MSGWNGLFWISFAYTALNRRVRNDDRSSAWLRSISPDVAVCTGAGIASIGRLTPGSGPASTTVTVVAKAGGGAGCWVEFCGVLVPVCPFTPVATALRSAQNERLSQRDATRKPPDKSQGTHALEP